MSVKEHYFFSSCKEKNTTGKYQNHIIFSVTIKVPIFKEHESLFWVVVEDELEHTEDEGQSPQEQPREISPHE